MRRAAKWDVNIKKKIVEKKIIYNRVVLNRVAQLNNDEEISALQAHILIELTRLFLHLSFKVKSSSFLM